MALSDIMAADAAALVSTNDFGEAVTYTKASGTTRTINAVIVRDPPERIDAGGNVFRPKAQVIVRNDATYGISSSELNVGGDRITFAMRPGETAKTFQLALSSEPDTIDSAMLTLEIR